MDKELQELQNTPASCELHTVQRVRVFGSGFDHETAHDLALTLEIALRQRGSSVQPQQGRWHTERENGYVIEVCVPTTQFDHVALTMTLRRYMQRTGFTFYVTIDQVTAMEVF